VIELGRHIEILLLDNDCVIVPELGGFVAHYIESRFDERDSVLLPPLRTLGFNPAIKLNDSLLVQSYIEAYDISYPEAMSRIEDEVEELQQTIEEEGFYELVNVGTLRQNAQGGYDFEPCEAGILTPSLYGLGAVEVETLAESAQGAADVKAETPGNNEKKALRKERSDKTTAQTVPLYNEEESAKTVSIRLSTLRNAVVAAVAIFVALFVTAPLNNGLQKELSLMNICPDNIANVLPKAIVRLSGNEKSAEKTAVPTKKVVESKSKATVVVKKEMPAPVAKTVETKQNTPETAVKTTEEKAEKVAPAEPAKSYYTLVLASQVSKKNAAAYVEKLHKDGFNGAAVYTNKSFTRVIFNRYATEDEARKALRSLRRNDEFSEAWIYRVNG